MKHAGPVLCASFSSDGELVLTASEDATARLWNGDNGQPISEPLQHPRAVTFAAFSRDGSLFLTVSGRELRIWHTDTHSQIGPALEHDAEIGKTCFTPDQRKCVAPMAGEIVSWDIESISGSPDEVQTWVEAVTQMDVSGGATVRLLELDAWQQRVEMLPDSARKSGP